MFRKFFYTRLLMAKACDKFAAIWRNKCSYQLLIMGKNVSQRETYLKHRKKFIKYADRAEKWLDRGTRILDQMKEEY